MHKVIPATHNHLAGMADVINPIIRAGGTTANEVPLSTADIAAKMVDRPTLISSFVALDADGAVAGFQYLNRLTDTPEIGDIASFARLEPKLPGVGRALMAETIRAAQAAGLREINATIRADNVPGLGFYSAMGFQDHSVTKGVPLNDGTPVDRIHKRLALG